MSFVANLLKRLEEERDEHARTALVASSGDAFDYGKVCGIYAGLERSRQILVEQISEAEDHDDRL